MDSEKFISLLVYLNISLMQTSWKVLRGTNQIKKAMCQVVKLKEQLKYYN